MNIPTIKATLAFQHEAILGECPVWDEKENMLYWVDILSRRLFRYDPHKKTNTGQNVGEDLGAVALREGGGLVMALRSGFVFFDLEEKKITSLADPESHLPGNRFNDGKCDPVGRFWAGTLSYNQKKGAGALYCINSRLRVNNQLGQLTIPNGMAWDTDHHKFYLVDSPKQRIYSFDYDGTTGKIKNRSIAVTLYDTEGLPDGMTIDRDNKLWIALYNGGKVIRVDPVSGRILYEITVPVPQVTSCTFGGSYFNDLYITTAREHMSKAQIEKDPLSGSLFKATVPVSGTPAFRFSG